MWVTGVGRKNSDIEVKMWFLGSYPSVVFDHGRLAMRDVYPWLDATSSVLGIRADDFETVAVDAPSERVPERILDHARQTIDRVFCETSFIEDYPFPVMVTS
jgi:hypothetical protein